MSDNNRSIIGRTRGTTWVLRGIYVYPEFTTYVVVIGAKEPNPASIAWSPTDLRLFIQGDEYITGNLNVGGTISGITEDIKVTEKTDDVEYRVIFVSTTGDNQPVYLNNSFTYNPLENRISATTFYGSATNLSVAGVTAVGTYYLTMVQNMADNQIVFANLNVYVNPNTGGLYATSFHGDGSALTGIIATSSTITDDTSSTAPQYLCYVAGLGTQNVKIAFLQGFVYYPSTTVLASLGQLSIGTVGFGITPPQSGIYVSKQNTTDTFSNNGVHIGIDVATGVPCVGLCTNNLSGVPYIKFVQSGNLNGGKIAYDVGSDDMMFYINQSTTSIVDLSTNELKLTGSGYSRLKYSDIGAGTDKKLVIAQNIQGAYNIYFSNDAGSAFSYPFQITREAGATLAADEFYLAANKFNVREKTTVTTKFQIDNTTGITTCGSNAATDGFLKVNSVSGGYGNAGPENFHIDNITNGVGQMLLNYLAPNCVVRIGNYGVGNFAVYANNIDPIFASKSTWTAGWDSRIRMNNTYTSKDIMIGHYHAVGYKDSQCIAALQTGMTVWDILFLNCVALGAYTYFASHGLGYCQMNRLFLGCHPASGFAGQGNLELLEIGRNLSFAHGIRIGGWNGTSNPYFAGLQMSYNFHIDGSVGGGGWTAGDMYVNFYAHYAGRYCRVYNFINASDRRIKKNITPYNDDELLDQIMNLEITTYNYKDKRFQNQNGHKQLGFIADSLENQSYFQYAYKISRYNIPFDNPIELDYTVDSDNKIITISNYTLDVDTTYYFYCYPEDGSSFRTMESKPLSGNTFKNEFIDVVYNKIELIGTVLDDCKNVSKEKLVAGAYAGIQILNRKIQTLENENQTLEARVIELETELNLIKEHLGL